MNSELLATLAAIGGAISGAIVSIAALGNMGVGRAGNVLNAAKFLQEEVTRLQKENTELRTKNEQLEARLRHKRIPESNT